MRQGGEGRGGTYEAGRAGKGGTYGSEDSPEEGSDRTGMEVVAVERTSPYGIAT